MAGFPPEDDVSSSKDHKRWYLDFSLLRDHLTTDYTINRAVEKATEPILLDVQDLKDEVAQLRATVANLEAKNAALERTQDLHAENQLIQLRLINGIRKKEPGKMELSRVEKIKEYLQARPDHKATFETLRGHLGVNKVLLSQSVKALIASSPGRYTIIKARGNRRVLVMLSGVKI